MLLNPHVRRLGADLAAFLLAAACSGCDEPGVLLCERCRAQLVPDPRRTVTPAGIPVRSALRFEGVAARCIRRLKNGETFLARPLGLTLGAVLALESTADTWIVPVPTTRSSFRRRGYRVPELLIRRARAQPQRVLEVVAQPGDQRLLGVAEREANVHDTMRALRRGESVDAVIVDDVVTTGATVDEAARALTAAGCRVRCAVALADTPRHTRFG